MRNRSRPSAALRRRARIRLTRPTVNSPAQLDALPAGIVVAYIGKNPAEPAIAGKTAEGWQFLGQVPTRRWTSTALAPADVPLVIIHDPRNWPTTITEAPAALAASEGTDH
jgi:hypothetical protein